MGVVYRAKQLGLNRVVALKMLIAGPFADPSLRARFLLEAESVAALEHPHIVKVFQFGEGSGHPYLAMEFLPGGTLADRIKKNGPLSSKEATELVAKLAEAVAHAHSRGVVHRDIKPLNVLMTADGEPRLTDFGLAKVGRADQNLSVTGQVLGTPAYMAPEQAAGKIHEVGTAADVYALGAVLYDVLTGRPPFQGDTWQATVQKVIHEEPERPRKHRTDIPRDLETICLKCLEKEQGKRYPTAQALADDLLRYLRNEPISVRPAGALERGYKWVKRNKVVSGAAAAVFLALLTGAGVSLAFGYEAHKQAEEAKKQKKDAEDAAEREEKEKLKVIDAQNKLQQQSAELKRTLAEALVGPITANNRDKPLTPYEVETFWRVAKLRQDDVAYTFLEEATRTPQACKRLECRGEYAFQAAIGLDRKRRDDADNLLLTRLRNPANTPVQRAELAIACSRAPYLSPSTAVEAASALCHTDVAWDNVRIVQSILVPSLLAVAQWMPPPEAANTLLATMKEADPTTAGVLALALASMCARLDPTTATSVCAEAARLLADKLRANNPAPSDLYQALSAISTLMEPDKAASLLATTFNAITDPEKRSELALILAGVASRMDRRRAADVCDKPADMLAAALAEDQTYDTIQRSAQGLAAVAAHIEPMKARKLCTGAAGFLARVMSFDFHADRLPRFHTLLLALSTQMEPGDATEMCLTALEKKAIKAEARKWLAECIVVLAARLERDKVAKISRTLTDQFKTAFAEEKYRPERSTLVEGLSVVTALMDPDEAAELLTNTFNNETDLFFQSLLAESLSRVAARMDSRKAAKWCEGVVSKLAAVRDKEGSPPRVVDAFQEVAQWSDSAEVADALLADLKKSSYPSRALRSLLQVAGRLDPDKAKTVCTEAAHELAKKLSAETNSWYQDPLARGLLAAAVWMDPTAAVDLVGSIAWRDCPGAGVGLAQALSTLAGRLDSTRAAKMRANKAIELIAFWGESAVLGQNGSYDRNRLSQGLSALLVGTAVPRQRLQYAPLLSVGSFATPHNLLPLALSDPHFLPRPLPPQELVELLKHPFCVGEARRVVLDALEVHYKRAFKDQWEFVEYVQKHQPQLDLLTPPKRPESGP
jgi:hypothetical protein